MTTMRRITISFDEEAEKAVNETRLDKDISLAKAVCLLVKEGYKATKEKAAHGS